MTHVTKCTTRMVWVTLTSEVDFHFVLHWKSDLSKLQQGFPWCAWCCQHNTSSKKQLLEIWIVEAENIIIRTISWEEFWCTHTCTQREGESHVDINGTELCHWFWVSRFVSQRDTFFCMITPLTFLIKDTNHPLIFIFFFLVLLRRCVKRRHFAGGPFLWGRSPSPSSYIFIADSPGHFRIAGRLGPAALCTLSGWVIQTKYVWNISGSAECCALGYSYQLQLSPTLCRVHECLANCVTSQWTLC